MRCEGADLAHSVPWMLRLLHTHSRPGTIPLALRSRDANLQLPTNHATLYVPDVNVMAIASEAGWSVSRRLAWVRKCDNCCISRGVQVPKGEKKGSKMEAQNMKDRITQEIYGYVCMLTHHSLKASNARGQCSPSLHSQTTVHPCTSSSHPFIFMKAFRHNH
jgi:hypothetical protein